MENFVQVFCCQNFLFTKAKMDEFNYLQFLMMIVSSLRLKKYFQGSFRHSVSSLTNILIVFPPHPLRMRAIQQRDKPRADSESTKCRFYQVPPSLKSQAKKLKSSRLLLSTKIPPARQNGG